MQQVLLHGWERAVAELPSKYSVKTASTVCESFPDTILLSFNHTHIRILSNNTPYNHYPSYRLYLLWKHAVHTCRRGGFHTFNGARYSLEPTTWGHQCKKSSLLFKNYLCLSKDCCRLKRMYRLNPLLNLLSKLMNGDVATEGGESHLAASASP